MFKEKLIRNTLNQHFGTYVIKKNREQFQTENKNALAIKLN